MSAAVSTGYTVGTTSTPILASNSNRAYLLISNQGPAIVYMCIGSNNNATVTNGFPIPVGGNYEQGSQSGIFVFPGDFACVTASGTATVVAIER